MHVHSGPDEKLRLQDDIDLARSAAEAGMRAVMIKSHITLTADRAATAEKVVPMVRVLGGLALNAAVGGLNPIAVEVAIRMGARQIWMPTSSAARDMAYHRRGRTAGASAREGAGITILREDGSLLPVVHEIIDLVAEADIILSTGHLSPEEVIALVAAARSHGLRRILVTHPEMAISNLPLHLQQSLGQPDVWFEHCFVSTLFSEPTPLAEIAARIRAVGPERIVLSTDLGIAGFPLPVDGMRSYLSSLMELGIPWRDLLLMTRDNAAYLLGI